MRRLVMWGLVALVVAAPAAAQQDTAQVRILSDSLRIELVRARGFIRAAETQLTKTMSIADRIAALLKVPVSTPLPPAPAVGDITLSIDPVSTSSTHQRVEFDVAVRDSAGAAYAGPISYSTDVGGITPSLLPSLTRQLLAGGRDDGAWFVPLGSTGTLTVRSAGATRSITHAAPAAPPAAAIDSMVTYYYAAATTIRAVSIAAGDSVPACAVAFYGSQPRPAPNATWRSTNTAVVRIGGRSARGAHCTYIVAVAPISGSQLQQMGLRLAPRP